MIDVGIIRDICKALWHNFAFCLTLRRAMHVGELFNFMKEDTKIQSTKVTELKTCHCHSHVSGCVLYPYKWEQEALKSILFLGRFLVCSQGLGQSSYFSLSNTRITDINHNIMLLCWNNYGWTVFPLFKTF